MQWMQKKKSELQPQNGTDVNFEQTAKPDSPTGLAKCIYK